MELPADFLSLMREHLGDEQAESLFRGLQEPPTVAVRFNPRKMPGLPHGVGDPVPWCPHAYYLPHRMAFTFDPLFHAGVYYVQDASSMYLAELLRKYMPGQGRTPLSAIDLCAAPGGKSTLLATQLPEGSRLTCNEPVRKRAQVLAENMAKWGTPGVSVTQRMPEDFTHMRSSFDFVLTDVPCSGEGMFRKDDGAIREWSLQNVVQCQQRQRTILRAILPTMRPGGLLVYSTCTFNRFEDEDNVQWLVNEFGLSLLEQRHFFPGRDRGEGIFFAALAAPGEYLPNDIHNLPSVETSPSEQQTSVIVPLSYADAIAYLRREALHIAAPRGIVTVTYKGIPLGQAKSVGTRLNNLYPQEWRIRTTYNPTEPVPDFFG